MQILVIHGSMRQGNTYQLTQQVVSRLAHKPDVTITQVSIADLGLPFCTSCHACLTKGEEYCPHDALLRSLRTAILECDGLILSGTTYVRALNAAMKNLLDHFAYLLHRPALFGKHGMVIATSAGLGEKNVAKYMQGLMALWGINGAMAVTRTTKQQRLQSDSEELPEKAARKLDKTVDAFYDSIRSQRQVNPTASIIAQHNFFRATSLSEYSESERDTEYWSLPGFSDRAYPVQIGWIKYQIGALAFSAAKLAMQIVGRSYMKRLKESSNE